MISSLVAAKINIPDRFACRDWLVRSLPVAAYSTLFKMYNALSKSFTRVFTFCIALLGANLHQHMLCWFELSLVTHKPRNDLHKCLEAKVALLQNFTLFFFHKVHK